jgi:hypothetical protein
MARLNNATDSYKLSNDEYVRRLSEITKSESANVIHRYGMTFADCPELQEILTEFIITCKLHDIAIPDDIKNSVK